MRIGVLDIQGDVSEHLNALEKLGVKSKRIRRREELNEVSGIIIPGGESTVIGSIMKARGIDKGILKKDLPVMGTCAGLILISEEVDGKRGLMPILKISTGRNAYGSQKLSFETDLEIEKIGTFRGVFIRAPEIKEVRGGEVLGTYENSPVLIKDGKNIGMTFHPEIFGDPRIHELFVRGLD